MVKLLITILIASLLLQCNIHQQGYILFVKVNASDSLKPNTKVILEGVEIGNADVIDRKLVRLNIKKNIKIPASAATSYFENILGEGNISITYPDSVTANNFLHEGDTLQLSSFKTVRNEIVEKLTDVKQVLNSAMIEALKDCIGTGDTFFNKNSAVQYVVIDSTIDVKVTLNGADTLLGYRFDCSFFVPRKMIPVLHSYSKDAICLERGDTEYYREFIVVYTSGIKHFESALAADMTQGLVAYRDYQKIMVENIWTGDKKVFEIPEKYAIEVPRSSIINGRLKLVFSDGYKLTLR